MSKHVRYILLSVCAAVGVAVALCVFLLRSPGTLGKKPVQLAQVSPDVSPSLLAPPEKSVASDANGPTPTASPIPTTVAVAPPAASPFQDDPLPASAAPAAYAPPKQHAAEDPGEHANADFARNLLGALKTLQEAQGGLDAVSAAADLAKAAGAAQGNPAANPLEAAAAAAGIKPAVEAKPASVGKTFVSHAPGEGDDRISMTIQGDDIRSVLEMLSEQGDMNILASNSVKGTVSASLKNVDVPTALDAILKSTGYVWRREGDFVYVGTPQDFSAMEQGQDRQGTRLYRLNYIKAADVQALITPMLTAGVGTISVNTPSLIGIAPDMNGAGGDNFTGQEAVLVRDYEGVLAQVDQVIAQVDRRPMQIAIEAMILSVNLDDSNEWGVDFEVLRDKAHVRVASGAPLSDLTKIDVSEGGLKVGFLDSSLSLFIKALETIGDTNVIATPRLMVLNKQRAEILIGESLGYVSTTQTETSTTQSVEFLDVGTQLRIRPFITNDGLVRMEVHPELSTGEVKLVGAFTLPQKRVTQVTTNIMVRDGATAIIGGLLRDEIGTTGSQIPYAGSLPVVGPLFRHMTTNTKRQEILILLTPRIVQDPDVHEEADEAAREFHHRHLSYADQTNILGKRYQGRKYFRLAQQSWAAGNGQQALRLINMSIHFDPLNRAALDLREDIWNGNATGDHTLNGMPPGGQGGAIPNYVPGPGGQPIPDWARQRLDETWQPVDPGRPGARYEIRRPQARLESSGPVRPATRPEEVDEEKGQP